MRAGQGVEVGIGDDAAVLALTPGRKLVVTTDVLVEGQHFSAELSAPADWGWKAVAVNCSDVAAMGALPRWLVLALTVPAETPLELLDQVYAGIREACGAFAVDLVGGDVSRGPALSLGVTALGEAERVVTRAGARPGDRLVVSGPLGAAAAGLALLRRDDEAAQELLGRFPALAAAHRRPCPDLGAGPRLAQAGATAMLDVSDGLAGDALHLAEASGTGLEIDDRSLPLAPGVREAAALLGRDPVELALGGGEDFVLAAALPAGPGTGPGTDRGAGLGAGLGTGRGTDRGAGLGTGRGAKPWTGLAAGLIDCATFTATPEHRVHLTPTGPAPLTGLAFDHFRWSPIQRD